MINTVLFIMGGGKLVSDYKRYKRVREKGLISLIIRYPEFRYQIIARMRSHSRILNILLKPFPVINTLNLYFWCRDIGYSLFIEHGFSTVIACRHIGDNCWINQQVTIGFQGKDSPWIGNNVEIKAGAKVIGNVTIGDDVIIGANAVVVKDVPSHSIVVGIPAHIIKTRNNSSEPWIRI